MCEHGSISELKWWQLSWRMFSLGCFASRGAFYFCILPQLQDYFEDTLVALLVVCYCNRSIFFSFSAKELKEPLYHTKSDHTTVTIQYCTKLHHFLSAKELLSYNIETLKIHQYSSLGHFVAGTFPLINTVTKATFEQHEGRWTSADRKNRGSYD